MNYPNGIKKNKTTSYTNYGNRGMNLENDLNDTNVVKRVSRPKEDGKFYLIVQPINVVDVFGNYTTVKEVKGVYKFDANAPTCETTFKLKSESVAEKTWTNQSFRKCGLPIRAMEPIPTPSCIRIIPTRMQSEWVRITL